jgi:hypothetical protein
MKGDWKNKLPKSNLERHLLSLFKFFPQEDKQEVIEFTKWIKEETNKRNIPLRGEFQR